MALVKNKTEKFKNFTTLIYFVYHFSYKHKNYRSQNQYLNINNV